MPYPLAYDVGASELLRHPQHVGRQYGRSDSVPNGASILWVVLVRFSTHLLELTAYVSRAFATTSSLSDRLKLQRNAAYPDWVLAPQVLLNCALGAKCPHHDQHSLLQSLVSTAVTEDRPTRPWSTSTSKSLDALLRCARLDIPLGTTSRMRPALPMLLLARLASPRADASSVTMVAMYVLVQSQALTTSVTQGCAPVKRFQTFTVSEYGKMPIKGTNQSTMVAQMMAEIYARYCSALIVAALTVDQRTYCLPH